MRLLLNHATARIWICYWLVLQSVGCFAVVVAAEPQMPDASISTSGRLESQRPEFRLPPAPVAAASAGDAAMPSLLGPTSLETGIDPLPVDSARLPDSGAPGCSVPGGHPPYGLESLLDLFHDSTRQIHPLVRDQ